MPHIPVSPFNVSACPTPKLSLNGMFHLRPLQISQSCTNIYECLHLHGAFTLTGHLAYETSFIQT